MSRLITVSNRLPVVLERDDDGDWHSEAAVGGLVTAMDPVMRRRGGVWIGWSGISDIDETEIERALAPLNESLRYELVSVPLSAREEEGFYQGFSNQIIWPLFHDQITACNFDPDYWRVYRGVNRKFAEAVTGVAGRDDFVWIHDYHLINVAMELRRLGLGNRIGFFLHIPFPTPDMFLHLPWRRSVLNALLSYDFVGFQTPQDRDNFARCVEQMLDDTNIERADGGVYVHTKGSGPRGLRIDALPIGIDYEAVVASAGSETTEAKLRTYRDGWTARKLVLGVDRLDYTKGLPEKLAAFRNALKRYPDLRTKVSLVQHVVPSRESVQDYADQRAAIEQLVGEINGQYTEPGWVPIHYLFHRMEPAELMAYYRLADIALITSLRDGMNLVSKEYCAAHVDDDGVLILSEFAGSAAQLKSGALLINPHDIEDTADRIHEAYHMPADERRQRMRTLRAIVRDADVYDWVERFLAGAGMVDDGAPGSASHTSNTAEGGRQ